MSNQLLPFNIISDLFNKYPTGTCICKLENVVDLSVLKIVLPGTKHSEYFILTDNVDNNIWGDAHLIPFNEKDFPNSLWEFLRPDGSTVMVNSKTVYFEESNPIATIQFGTEN